MAEQRSVVAALRRLTVRVRFSWLFILTMEKTIEQRAAETILQQSEEITINGKTYNVAPPSVATLIRISEAVSLLPHIKLNDENPVEESLAVAKNCRPMGDIVATLILGAKHIDETITVRHKCRKKRLCGLIRYNSTEENTITRKEALAKELLENLTPRELHNIVSRLLIKMQIGDFFGLTTFLTEINLLRPTKVGTTITEVTASGQS